jgi:peroxiredoxin
MAVWRRHWQLAGKPLNAAHRDVHEVLRTTKIVQIPGAGFYPLAGTITLHSPDPAAEPMPTIDELVAGKAYQPKLIASHEIGWSVERVEPNGASAPATYRAAFPAKTEIFDERSLAERPHAPLRRGQVAPPLHVGAWSDGRSRTLADLGGRIVVLYFWMDGHEACTAPLGALDAIQRKYTGQKVTVLGIHVGNVGLDELKHATAGQVFPHALDTGTDQTPGSTLTTYGVRFYPTTVIVDPQGRIAYSTDDPPPGGEVRQTAGQTGAGGGATLGNASDYLERLYGETIERQLAILLGPRPSANR